jgi:hypothetical protein
MSSNILDEDPSDDLMTGITTGVTKEHDMFVGFAAGLCSGWVKIGTIRVRELLKLDSDGQS